MAKMHQVRFQQMLRPRPRSGSYSASTDLPVVFKGPTSKGSEGGRGSVRRRGTEKRGEGQEEGEVKGFAGPMSDWLLRAWLSCC